MRSLKKFIPAVLATVSLLISGAQSQTFGLFDRAVREEIYLLVDYAAFKAETPGKIRLEVYCQIYNAGLNFEKKGDVYQAEYELSVKLYNEQMVVDSYSQNRRVSVTSQKKTVSRDDYRTNQINFELAPGKYELKVQLADPNSRKVITRDIKIKLKDFDADSPRLSDIELVQAAHPAGDSESVFDKGTLAMVPSVTHLYGVDDGMRLQFYMEIYRGRDSLEDVFVETALRHETRGLLYRDSLTSSLASAPVRQFREISLDELYPGRYELIVTLRGHRMKKIDIKHRDFEVVWSNQALLKHDLKSVVGQLRLISDDKDVDEIEKAATWEERLKAFNDFWQRRDPTPGTPENEARNEFYHRVAIANQNFSVMHKKGWKTDRGRIYIVWGEPDQVDDYPVVLNRRPYQEWHYYRYNKYRKFVFVDVNEDGDYRLEYPYDGLYQRPDF